MTQINSAVALPEIVDRKISDNKPVINNPTTVENQEKIATDSVEIPEKKADYEDPFKKKAKEPVKPSQPPKININPKDLVNETVAVQDTTKPLPRKPELNIDLKDLQKQAALEEKGLNSDTAIDTSSVPRIEVDFEGLINYELEHEHDPDKDVQEKISNPKSPKIVVDMRGIDFGDNVVYTPKPVKPSPVSNPNQPIPPITKPAIVYTPVPADLNSVVTTTYSDIRGNKIRVRGDAVAPLNKLMEITSKKNIRVAVTYGYRSVDEQQRLWSSAIVKYGSAARARKWVAPPGKSRHNKGFALDITMYKDGKKIGQAEFDKIITQAGFYRPMSWEGWHIEPASSRRK